MCLHGVLVCMLRILEEQTPSGVVLKENKDTPAAAEAEVREKKGERESYSSAVLAKSIEEGKGWLRIMLLCRAARRA